LIKKGIIVAGGTGTRLSPLTKAVNKQLLALYDKPLIFYPLSILMLAGIKNILIIVNNGQEKNFFNILGNGKRYGISIKYKVQRKPRGIADAFILGKNFIKKDNIALILGDNFFYGQSLTAKLLKAKNYSSGATIFLKTVNNPESLYEQKSLGLSHKQDHAEPIPIPYAVYDFEFYWNYKLRIKNNSSKTAYNIKIEKIIKTASDYLQKLDEIASLKEVELIELDYNLRHRASKNVGQAN